MNRQKYLEEQAKLTQKLKEAEERLYTERFNSEISEEMKNAFHELERDCAVIRGRYEGINRIYERFNNITCCSLYTALFIICSTVVGAILSYFLITHVPMIPLAIVGGVATGLTAVFIHFTYKYLNS